MVQVPGALDVGDLHPGRGASRHVPGPDGIQLALTLRGAAPERNGRRERPRTTGRLGDEGQFQGRRRKGVGEGVVLKRDRVAREEVGRLLTGALARRVGQGLDLLNGQRVEERGERNAGERGGQGLPGGGEEGVGVRECGLGARDVRKACGVGECDVDEVGHRGAPPIAGRVRCGVTLALAVASTLLSLPGRGCRVYGEQFMRSKPWTIPA